MASKRSGTTAVRSLRARETTCWPTERPSVEIHQHVFLPEPEPWLLVNCGVHDFLGSRTVVRLVGGTVVVVRLSHNEDVITATGWVLEDGSSPKVDIGVGTIRLVS